MNPNIINPHKYKKITRSDKLKRNKKAIKNIKTGKYKKNKDNYQSNTRNVKKSTIKKRKKKNNSNIFINLFKVACSIILIIVIGYVSSYIVDSDNNAILNVFKSNNGNTKLVANYDFRIGINNLDSNNNIVINELYKNSERKLITIDEQYNIEYKIANEIVKIDDKTYEIEIKDTSDIYDVIYTIDNLKKTKSNRYYKYLSNIATTEVKDDNILKLILFEPNPYIIYSLDFNIEKKNVNTEKQNSYMNKYNYTANSKGATFIRNDSVDRDVLKSISIINYLDKDTLLKNFRNNSLDMFLTSSEEDMRLIGKHEYSVKKYRNGESYFLFGNKDSLLFSLKEVRKAIAYSLNRNEIAKQISSSFTEVIDIPYIYSGIGYRYDIYGAENSLIAESWNKSSGLYNKRINNNIVNLELTLLVNSEDIVKVNIAENIKQMLQNVGIRINIHKLKNTELINRIKKGNYDLVLTTVYINDNPDITYLEDFININDNINNAITKVNTSNVEDLSINIRNLQSIISNEIACIGIAIKNTNIVYQKYITGFDNISYMNIFKDIDKVGKIIE